MPIIVFWNVAPCSLVDVNQHFEGTFSRPSTKLQAVTSQKIASISHRLENLKYHETYRFFICLFTKVRVNSRSSVLTESIISDKFSFISHFWFPISEFERLTVD
jgi:hypothetical protein